MASLSTASCFTQEAPTGLWRGEKRLFLSASSPSPSPSPSSSTTMRRPRNRSLCVSASRRLPASSSSSQNRRLPRLRVAASKRISEKQKSIIDEPSQFEGEGGEGEDDDEEYVLPELPGAEPDFWEGPQFEILGFIIQYLWAIGIFVALGGCFIAVKTYNEGASDFKETQVYKESMESQGFLEAPSDSKVFDEPPSQDAPPVTQEGSS